MEVIYHSGLHRGLNAHGTFLQRISKTPHQQLSNSAPLNFHSKTPLPWIDYLLSRNPSVIHHRDSLKTDLLQVAKDARPKIKAQEAIFFPDIALPSMLNLALTQGFITSLPNSFGEMTLLTSLSLDGNRLGVIPSPILRLTSLVTLSVAKNRISYLPDLSALTNLKVFSASRNKLHSVSGICRNKNLFSLHLDGNSLMSIPYEFVHLVNLVRLDLADNNLTFIPSKVLVTLSRYPFTLNTEVM